MTSNLPDKFLANWTASGIVMPVNTNSWESAINTIIDAIKIYASTGNFYTIKSFETSSSSSSVLALQPVSYLSSNNETLSEYREGMQVGFMCSISPTGSTYVDVNINNLGVKQIKKADTQTRIKETDLVSGLYYSLVYDSNQNCFYISSTEDKANKNLSNLSTAGQAIINSKADNTLSNVTAIDDDSAVQEALNMKANTSLSNLSTAGQSKFDAKVNKSGDTMTGPLIIYGNTSNGFILKDSRITRGTVPSSAQYSRIRYEDKNENALADIYYRYNKDGDQSLRITCASADGESSAGLYIGFDSGGTAYCSFPKCSTPATTTSSATGARVAVIVQNYKNGASWYRVWSDGWIEQGGNAKNGTTVALLKNFTTTNYIVQATKSVTTHDGNFELLSITSKTKTNFYMSQSGFTYAIYADWYACGY